MPHPGSPVARRGSSITVPTPMSRRTTLTAIPTAVYPAAAVALLALAANAAALRNGFAGDDVPIVQKNAVVHGFGDLRHLLLGSYWPGTRELYRPLTLLSFATDWTLSGGSPTWLHAVNLLLHAGVCVLLLLLLVRLGAHRWAAAAAVGLFAVHPVHVEAVANLVGRGELLAALFVVAACLVHLRPGPSSPARVAAVCACYFLGLAGKEIAVTLPALLLVLDWFRSREGGEVPRRLPALVRARLPLLVAMAGVLALFLALRVQVTGGATGTGAAPYLADLSTGRRLLVALSLWPQYVRLLVWPADLSFDWGPGILAIPAGVTPAVAMGVGCILLLALAARRDGETGRGWIALAVLWFGFAILPVSQVAFPLGTLLAERTLYLPSVALVMAVQPLWALLGRTRAAAVPAAVALAVLLAMGGWWSWRRSAVWASTPAIRADLAAHHPESWRAIWDRASESAAAGRMGDALEHYTRALELTHANEPGVNTEAAAYLLEIGSPVTAEGLCRRTLAY
ncbi:MAG TPA: hypothetical protein VFH27_11940, partial [Longimicrobiaceae bacterium]|nr:hypothetical protein [Longimicrobiaceae bacterium]